MSDNLRQRRGKKSVGTAAAAGTASASSETTNKGKGGEADKPTPIDQLRGAQAKLIVSRDRTADLHTAWKHHLLRLSLLIVAVCIHQLQKSISSCIHEIKDSTNENEAAVTGFQAIKLIFGDSFCECLGVIISSLLVFFLILSIGHSNLELDHWPYMVSSALVPVCLGFYFHGKQSGCIGENNDLENDDGSGNDQRHQFPAVVIYHTIVTVAYWFMKSGMQSAEGHVKLVTDSIRDFERMDKKMELKKQLKATKARISKKK